MPFLTSLAFKLVPFGQFLKANWKPLVIAGALVGGYFYFEHWKAELVSSAKTEQRVTDEAKYSAAITAANKISEHDNATMQLFATAFGALSNQRSQAIDLKVTPQIERIQNEVASDPRYSDCRVSDGVLGAANAARSAVDAGIAASNPKAN
jgi:hypothetical protein